MYYIWQFNGVTTWDNIIQWCNQNLYHWQARRETITFYDEREYLIFLLRWS